MPARYFLVILRGVILKGAGLAPYWPQVGFLVLYAVAVVGLASPAARAAGGAEVRVLWRVIVKEFLQLRQDRKMIPVLLVAPLVQLLVFGFAANLDVTNVPIVLVDQDRTAASRDLVERFPARATSSSWAPRSTAAEVDPWLVTATGPDRPRDRAGFGAARSPPAGRPPCR